MNSRVITESAASFWVAERQGRTATWRLMD
jgi:hypothetical protein